MKANSVTVFINDDPKRGQSSWEVGLNGVKEIDANTGVRLVQITLEDGSTRIINGFPFIAATAPNKKKK